MDSFVYHRNLLISRRCNTKYFKSYSVCNVFFRNFGVLVNLFCHLIFETQIFILQLKDCNVVASKLVLILDDLLWVLTDSQLKAMVQYAKSLSEAIEKSAEQRKSLATETAQVCGMF